MKTNLPPINQILDIFKIKNIDQTEGINMSGTMVTIRSTAAIKAQIKFNHIHGFFDIIPYKKNTCQMNFYVFYEM